jgi:hypothetical protein
VEAATASLFPQDRVCSWYAELQRIADRLPSLSPGARCAVADAVASFMREGEADAPREGVEEILAALSTDRRRRAPRRRPSHVHRPMLAG